jgi:sugar lactone lactonase YvrE
VGSADAAVALLATLSSPRGVAVSASSGAVFFSDSGNSRIRAVTPSGGVETLAGTGGGAFANGFGAGAALFNPGGLRLSGSGSLLVADTANHALRALAPPLGGSSVFTVTLAGRGGVAGAANGIGALATFSSPAAVVQAPDTLAPVTWLAAEAAATVGGTP